MKNKEKEFLELVEAHKGIIHKISRMYMDAEDDQQDLTQEIIYQLWKSFQTFSEQSKLSTWIYRVALNVAIYQLKKSRKIISTVPIDKQALNYHEQAGDEMEEKWKVFRQQIENLHLLDKGIVLLYLDNKSYEEIAEIIGISKTNVGTKLQRIKERLKNQINKNV